MRPVRRDHHGGSLESGHASNFGWLLRLRWSAIAGQVITIVAVHAIVGIDLPLGPLAAIILFEVATNIAAHHFRRITSSIGEPAVASLMIVDVLCLTGLLYFTGGPFNPFSFLYLVYIALAAVVLRPRWAWPLVTLSLACLGGLFFKHVRLELGSAHSSDHMGMHLKGMWVASAVAAVFIVYFVHRVTSALARREADLAKAREEAVRAE